MTFLAVMIGWVFFRAETFSVAGQIIAGLIGITGVDASWSPEHTKLALKLVFALSLCFFAPNTWNLQVAHKPWHAFCLGILFTLCILSLGEPSPFLYFQF
jgi:alginate O-acetyltransferase complex protein AlgI